MKGAQLLEEHSESASQRVPFWRVAWATWIPRSLSHSSGDFSAAYAEDETAANESNAIRKPRTMLSPLAVMNLILSTTCTSDNLSEHRVRIASKF